MKAYRPCWHVQQLEDGAFLAPDFESGVITVCLLANARPFLSEEAALEAVVDHCDGQASVVKQYITYNTCEEAHA